MKKKTKRRGRGEGACFFSEANNCWVARAVVAGERVERTAPTKGEVLDKIRIAREQGVPTDGARTSMRQYLRHWIDAVHRPRVELTTWIRDEQSVRLHLIPYLGSITLANLKAHHVEDAFQRMRADGVGNGSLACARRTLSRVLRHACRGELITKIPPLPQARQDEPIITPFTPDEVRKILEAAKAYRTGVIFPVAVATGMRLGEILAFGWQHVDLEKGTIQVERSLARAGGEHYLKKPKSKRGRRTISLPPFAVNALKEFHTRLQKEGNENAETVICSSTGRFLAATLTTRLFKPALARAGVPYRKFHTFRHTHASELLSRGVSVVEVARRLGDRADVVLSTYAHWIPGTEDVCGRLEGLYAQGGEKVD